MLGALLPWLIALGVPPVAWLLVGGAGCRPAPPPAAAPAPVPAPPPAPPAGPPPDGAAARRSAAPGPRPRRVLKAAVASAASAVCTMSRTP